MEQLNIVELIESNPITKLSTDYNVKLLTKIKANFSDFEQQLFLTSFYCYLNYHPTNDFVIDLDDVWKWVGFSVKIKAKTLLEKYFKEEIDYKKSLCDSAQQTNINKDDQKKTRGGQNIQKIFLNIKTFKLFCIKAETKKADEIHKYFMKIEEIIQETINDETNELRLQLEQKNKILDEQNIILDEQNVILSQQNKVLENVEKDKEKLKEATIIEQFPVNTQCIYIGKIDNKTLGKPNSKMYHESVIKFGQSNDLTERVKCHKKTFDNFRLYAAYKVKNKIEIENAIKKHPILQKRIRLITTEDGITHREMLALDDDQFTIDKIEVFIKEIIKQNEYNIENYNLLLKKNAAQEIEINQLKEELSVKSKQLTDATNKVNAYTGEGDVAHETKNKIASNYAICKYGYFLYVYQYENMRFICSITRQKDIETLTTNLNNQYPKGEMKYNTKVYYAFSEKNMMFLLKQHCICLGSNKFEASFEDVKSIIDIAANLEKVLTENSKDLPKLQSILNNEGICSVSTTETNYVDPEVPQVRKAKRSIDQINKDTGEIMKTYESIEAAGRSLGLTTGTAIGIAVRESRVCQGFLWRYTGVSKEEQFNEQPVIKVCCSNGEKTCFKTIADAARDCNISAPALRRRILTNVHMNDHHWIFDKNATHYK
jgi:hypothetical protein